MFIQIHAIAVVFPLFLKFQASLWFHFPSTWRTSYCIYFRTDLLVKNVSSPETSYIFLHLKVALFCLHFWRVFLLDIEFSVDSSFFQDSKDVLPLFCGFRNSWGETRNSFESLFSFYARCQFSLIVVKIFN